MIQNKVCRSSDASPSRLRHRLDRACGLSITPDSITVVAKGEDLGRFV